MAVADSQSTDPAVIAWHVDVTYEVLGGRKKGSAAGQGERMGLKRIFKPDRQIGAVRHVQAVKDVSFVANRGESIGIIGHNGSGKSTLLRALAGLVPPTHGHIWIQGQPSLLGVNAVLLNQLSGERNIYIGGQALGMTKEQIREHYDDIVELADIGEAIERPMSTYSSGQGARLRFAISTAVRPDILMIDEALATGDAAFRQRSMAKINTILEGASTVFLVSHSNSTITEMCQRALWLDQGRLVMDGPAAEVVAAYAAGKIPTPLSGSAEPVMTARELDIPAPGENLKIMPVDDDSDPVMRAVIWGPGSSLWTDEMGDFDAAQHAELLESLASTGLVNLACSSTEAAEKNDLLSGSQGWEQNCAHLDLGDEPLATVLPELLESLGLRPHEALVLDGDEGYLASVAQTTPGVMTRSTADPETFRFLRRFVRRFEGAELPQTELYAALVRRFEVRRKSQLPVLSFHGRHKVQFTILDRLAGFHLGPQLESLVQSSRKLNYTHSKFAVGEMQRWLAGQRRNRCFTVVAWDDFGMLGVVGFVSIERGTHQLQHFVFADGMDGLELPEAVVTQLQTTFGQTSTEFPVLGDPPWAEFIEADQVMPVLASSGLASPARPEIRVMAGGATGAVMLGVQPATTYARDAAGTNSIKVAFSNDYLPGAALLLYWAGQDYDDQIWGAGQPGLDHFRRTIEAFVDRRGSSKLVVLLPSERASSNTGDLTLNRLKEFNQLWRDATSDAAGVEVVEGSALLGSADTPSDPRVLKGELLVKWVQLIRDRLGHNSHTALATSLADPQHLAPVANFRDLGELMTTPLPLPAVWEGRRARIWEVEVQARIGRPTPMGALLLVDVDDQAAILTGPSRVVPFGKSSAQFYRYLETSSSATVTRFIIEGKDAFAPTNLALQLWGTQDCAAEIRSVRIWTHRSSAQE